MSFCLAIVTVYHRKFASIYIVFLSFSVYFVCSNHCKNSTQRVDQPMGQSQNFVAENELISSSNVNRPSLCVPQSSCKDEHAEIYRLEGIGLQILRNIKDSVMHHSDEEAWDDLGKSNFIDIEQGNFVDSIIAASMHSDFL